MTTPNWKDFGMVLVEKYGEKLKLKKSDVLNLHLSYYYGRESPAMNFLSRLPVEWPSFDLPSLSSLAKELNRNDISQLVNDWSASKTLFTQLSQEQLETLSGLLQRDVLGVGNWRHFADRLHYSNIEIAQLELLAKAKAGTHSLDRSPTCRLLGLIEENYPKFEVSLLCEVASECCRTDVVEFFRTIMESVGEIDDDEPVGEIDDDELE